MWSNKDQTGSCFPSSTSNGSIHDPSHLPDESIDIPSYPPESSGSIHSQPHLPVSSGSIYHPPYPPTSSGSSFRDRRGKPTSTTKTQKRLGYASLVKPIPSGSSKIRGGSSRKSSVKQLSNEVDLPMFPDPSVLSGNANVYARSGKSDLYPSFILPDTSVGAKAGSDVLTDVILEPNGQDETDDDDEEEEERQKTSKTKPRSNGGPGGKKTKGKLKIKMEFIDDKVRRYTTFSKRKTGIMKKAYELSTLTGTQVMLLVASETGHVYTFATKKLQPIITSDAGKALIKTCLNSPDAVTSAAVPSSENRMSATGFEETEFTYSVPENEK